MSPNQPGQPPKLPIPGVRNLIAVGSGKGGVGKTTVAVNLAIALAKLGHKVGLLDADVYGPNVPLMMGINQTPMAHGDRIQPLQNFGVKLMSMGFLNPGDKPLVWRGPMLHSVIQQFLRGVDWGELDYLVIDLPPGTGDVQLTLIQTAPITGAIVVTTPSAVSLEDARKAVHMFAQVKVEILGIVENMSYLLIPGDRARSGSAHRRRHRPPGRDAGSERSTRRDLPRAGSKHGGKAQRHRSANRPKNRYNRLIRAAPDLQLRLRRRQILSFHLRLKSLPGVRPVAERLVL